MTAYWVAFLVPAMAVLWPFRATPAFRRFMWLFAALWLALFVGLRHQVGADWFNYLVQFNDAAEGRFIWSEPGYAAVNWLMIEMGLDIHAVNLICGGIFVAGLLY